MKSILDIKNRAIIVEEDGRRVRVQLKLINDEKFVEYIGHLIEYVTNCMTANVISFEFIPNDEKV